MAALSPVADPRADVDLFVNDDGALEAHVSTERLYLRSVGAGGDELRDYQALFASPRAMERYHEGADLVYDGPAVSFTAEIRLYCAARYEFCCCY